MLDGFVARVRGCETRIGAALDILCDRFCAAAFYVGLMWLEPDLVAGRSLVYLAEFMVVDCFLSLAFLAWPMRSPNYFFVIDRPLWLWNWSKPGKAVNSSLFAVLLLVLTEYVGVAIAVTAARRSPRSLLVMKCGSLARLVADRPPDPAHARIVAHAATTLVEPDRGAETVRRERRRPPTLVGGVALLHPAAAAPGRALLRWRARPLLSPCLTR